jgi:hypothetical protein
MDKRFDRLEHRGTPCAASGLAPASIGPTAKTMTTKIRRSAVRHDLGFPTEQATNLKMRLVADSPQQLSMPESARLVRGAEI